MRIRTVVTLGPVVIAAAVLACSEGTEPEDVVPRLATYDYLFQTPTAPGAPFAVTCEGTFRVTYATADSIAGLWDVPACRYLNNQPAPGYQPQPLFGFWNVDAYVLWARPTNGGQHVHRFSRRNGLLECASARNTYGTSGGGIASVEAVCSLTQR